MSHLIRVCSICLPFRQGPVCAIFLFCGSLEHEPRDQINRIISRGVSPSPIIIHPESVEPPIACILDAELNILHRPVGNIDEISIGPGISRGAASYRSWGGKRPIRRPCHHKSPASERIPVADMIHGIEVLEVEIMSGERSASGGYRPQKIRALVNVVAM